MAATGASAAATKSGMKSWRGAVAGCGTGLDDGTARLLTCVAAAFEQQRVDGIRQLRAGQRMDIISTIRSKLCLDAARMCRQQKDPVSDQHCLGNRVGDEQDGETRVVPQRQEFVLHLAP